jgi:hypothetical protein
MGMADLTSSFAQALDVEGSATLLFEPARAGVLSWNTYAESGTISFRLLRAHVPATVWLDYAEWHPGGSKSFSPTHEDTHVDVDVITSDQPFAGIAVRARDVHFNLVAFATTVRCTRSNPYARSAFILDVPARSQYAIEGERGWCSPTALSMLHAYHGIDVPIEETARAVFDRAYNGTGNWSFNVAYSGRLGLRGVVAYLRNFDHAQRLIERNIPIVISYSWGEGELPGAPLEHSDGHLSVLTGFVENGDAAVNDPAAPGVRVVYPRTALETIWQRGGGVAYVVAPAGIDYTDILTS